MTIPAGTERGTRVVEAGGRRFRAALAWRGSASDYGLLYFVALDGGEPDPDDRQDRRSLVEPGLTLDAVSEEELRRSAAEGKPLTDTERRFRAPDGRLWLAQSAGPVWADREPAEGSTGLVFTALEGPADRLRGPGAHAGERTEDELADLWRRSGSGGTDGGA